MLISKFFRPLLQGFLYKPLFLFTSRRPILAKYEALISSNKIRSDNLQVQTIKHLERVKSEVEEQHRDWMSYSTELAGVITAFEHKMQQGQVSKPVQQQKSNTSSGGGLFGGIFQKQETEKIWRPQHKDFWVEKLEQADMNMQEYKLRDLNKIKGLYLFGSPGSGKTFLMDLFYENVNIQHKQRIHFNEFMLNINKELHIVEKMQYRDPLVVVARKKARDTRLLCLDEFQVTDIADALILKKLFETLFEHNLVLVCTSNRLPDDLYKGGLQRHVFLPFIPFLKSKVFVLNMDSQVDYRYQKSRPEETFQTYYNKVDMKSEQALNQIFCKLAKSKEAETQDIEVIKGRSIKIKFAKNGVSMFTFSEICDSTFGASDFIAIARNFHSIILKEVPFITMENRNAARRLILFIDELYNNKVKFYCSAKHDLENLFDIKGGFKQKQQQRKQMAQKLASSPSQPNKQQQQQQQTKDNKDGTKKKDDVDEIYDEQFALERCKSRITEMQSKEYRNELSYYEENVLKKKYSDL